MSIRTPWRAIAAMFLLNGALFGIWASRIPAIANEHALGKGELGLVLLFLAGGAILAFPLAGMSVDRAGAAWTTRWIAAFYGLAIVGIALAPDVYVLALAVLFFGACHGAMDVSMNAWGAEVERMLARPVMSSYHAMFSLGAGLGAGTGWLAAGAGYSPLTHFSLASLGLSCLCLWFAMIPWQQTISGRASAQKLFAFPRGSLLCVGIAAFCASLGEGAMADWSALFLVAVTMVSEAEATLGYLVYSIAMVIMRLLGDRIIQKLGAPRAAQLAGLSACAGVLLAVFSGQYMASLAGFVLMGIGYAIVMPLAFSRAANDPVIKPGSAIASVSTLGYGGMLLGPPLIGFLAEWISLQWSFLLLAALALGIVAMAPFLGSRS